MKLSRLRGALLATTSAAALSMGAVPAVAACYTGPFPFTNRGALSCVQITNTSFTGNISNAGTISAGGIVFSNGTMTGMISSSGSIAGGIALDSNSMIVNPSGDGITIKGSFAGGISNGGTISANGGRVSVLDTGIAISGQTFRSLSTLSGGITNTGTILARTNGIVVRFVSNFAGGIVNGGTISTSKSTGILISNGSTFAGGITNAGTISSSLDVDINISLVSTFLGGVTNTGLLSAGSWGIRLFGVTSFDDGISNSGAISAMKTGILLSSSVKTFQGGITSTGMISAGGTGIEINGVSTFLGGVTNSGTITAGAAGNGKGIFVTNANIANTASTSGSVINSGSIVAGSAGILVNNSTIGGSVSNAGTIAGGIGVVVESASVGGSVGNGGTIVTSAYTGLGVADGGTVAGDIINTGSITNTSPNVNVPIFISEQSVGGSVINAAGATISGAYGIAINGSSAAGHPAIVDGNIVNAGTISASNRSGMALFTVTVGGDVINSGTITAGRNGIRVVNTTGAVGGATIAGGITNSGTISSTGVGFNGIALIGAAVSQGITNSGAVTAQGAGILVEGGEILGGKIGLHGSGSTAVQAGPASMVPGSLTNSGAISARTGILVSGGAVVAGGIANSGDITGSVSAIDVTGEGAATTISQMGGTIAGNILLSALADTDNVLGGAINGNIVGAGSSNTINFDPGDGNTFTYAAPFGFSGINQVNVVSGTTVLNGANSATNVTVANSVLEIGNASTPGATLTASVNVNDLGTLSGFGTVAGAVTINSGGTLAPGDAPGTITIGPLTLNSGSMLAYQLGTAGVVGGPTNDLTIVNGAVTINGDTLFVTNSSGFGVGTYRLINYSGALGGSGSIVVGTLPDGDTGVIQTSIAGQVNLIVTAPPPTDFFYWDGTTTVADGTIHGGNGTWDNVSTNWTNSNATANAAWQGISAVFEGAAGTVNVVDTITYQSLQFSTNGYVITASGSGALTPNGVAPIIVDGLLTATIAAPITGSGGIDKTGLGTLILTGNDNYTGGTTITAGTLQVGNGGTTGSIVGNVVDNDMLAFDRSDTVTFGGAISGTGGLLQIGTGTVALTANESYSGGTAILAGTLQLGNGGTTGAIVGDVADDGILAFDRSDTVTYGGVISGSGAVQQIGTGTVVLTADESYTGATVVSAGTLALSGSASIAASSGVTDNGTFSIAGLTNGGTTITTLSGGGSVALGANTLTLSNASGTFTGAIGGSGGLVLDSGTETLSGTNTYTGATLIDVGTLALSGAGSIASSSGVTDNDKFDISALSDGATTITTLSGRGSVVLGANTLTLSNASGTFSGVIGGSGGLTLTGGTETLSGTNTYTGVTLIDPGTLALSGTGSIALSSGVIDDGTFSIAGLTNGGTTITTLSGSGSVVLGANTLTLTAASGVFSGTIGGNGGFTLNAGTETLSGLNTYTGPTTVNAGALEVNGSIASSSLTTVNSGAVLLGNGTVGNTQINSGGVFAPGTMGAPGTSMTVAGNLAFQSGALYMVQIGPADATFANVSGTATLAGTVEAVFTHGDFMVHRYDILHAGTVSGTFSAFSTINLPPDLLASLSYTGSDVFLNLTAEIGKTLATEGLNVNQTNVANAINNFFNGGGALPPGFANLFDLTGSNLANALTQLDGEDATGAEHAAFELTNEFLSLMLDPFVYGRGGPASGGGPLGFAPDQQANFPPDVALAYAGVLKAPPKQTFDQRWTVWGTGFGGSGTANGDPVIGSNNVTASTYGFAAGVDYHVNPDTVLGFALAGAGTNWNLAQALGTGRSDAFQAGVYGTRYFGPAYIGAALAFTNNWFTTNRTALGDELTANFQGQSFGARLEGGYRYAVAPTAGVTPYAAIQAQSFHTPSYSETDLTAGGFGLTYNAMSATDTRSELGARFDALMAWGAMPVQLRARIAWAHDWVSNPALDAAFQALPGASFVVNGAAVPANSALTSVGAELHLTPRWTLLGKFDGEFASAAQTYAGSGTLRYSW